ncbi:O-antigen translocase [Psychroserpens sp. S379A]|uniref:O-antigen translocase n=1 Tax=Psychroserpens sp. S379A TaxID=3415137 RepID=UPI003C79D39E
MTSLNAVVIFIRLVVSLFIQRLLATNLGEAGIAKIGQIRNLLQIVTSTSSLGTFNGIVKYVAEFENEQKKLSNLFSTAFIFGFLGALVTGLIIFFNAEFISLKLFKANVYAGIIKCLAFILPVISINRILYGIINGQSDYKSYAKIELSGYLLATVSLLIFLYYYSLKGVLFSIIISPLISFAVILYIAYKKIKIYLKLNELSLNFSFAKPLLAFVLMSFVSSVLINYIEIDIRTTIANRINIKEAGYWTAINFISRNYMVFSASLFTLYVIPKFAKINTGREFKNEVIYIYKTILPLFGVGMILVYMFRNLIISIVYPNFEGIEPLFKWQLLGDFVRLATLVLSYQFHAKRMVWSFVITEFVSLGLFYFLSKHYVDLYGAEGVVIAHFYRYILYFLVVVFAVWYYFKSKSNDINE